MDPMTQLCAKLNAEQTYQSTRPRSQRQVHQSDAAPPPYDSDTSDSDDEDDELALTLTINAAHSVHGNNNLIPTSPTPLADATRFSAILLAAVKQINHAVGDATTQRPLKLDLTIHCGITVVGDRNVIGNVGLRPRSPTEMPGSTDPMIVLPVAAMAGAKRKADDSEDDDGGSRPAAKRAATETICGCSAPMA